MMSKDELKLVTYSEVFNTLDKEKSHLLLGNGFNNSLGIRTDYSTIFKKMQEEYKGYSQLQNLFQTECTNDIEQLIGKLSEQIVESEDSYAKFLREYINDKTKHDFMKATYQIVKTEIRKIYQEKTAGIYLLMEKFTNYFTLNYDPLLYLLLMKFKKDETEQYLALQHTFKYIEEDLNMQNNYIYTEIKKAHESGKIITTVDVDSVNTMMSAIPKTEFENAIKNHFKSKNWQQKDIKKVTDKLWEEIQGNKKNLEVNDGLFPEEIEENKRKFLEGKTQNLFFLHGAFHIYKKKRREYKITQTTNKSLYNKLWEIIQDEERDIICILKNTNKLEEINKHNYLRNGYEKLSNIQGNLVIIGCSLSKNDHHLFRNIHKNTNIQTIFYSSCERQKTQDSRKLKELFPNKKIILFDRETISYSMK